MPKAGASSSIATPSSEAVIVAGIGSPWARTCTRPRQVPSRGRASAQVGRMPSMRDTASRSRGPTVTVLSTGEMPST